MSKTWLAIVSTIALMTVSPVFAQPAQKCRQNKSKCVCKKACDKFKAIGKNEEKPDAAKFAAAVSKLEGKFTTCIDKAEAKGGCPAGAATGTLEAKVNAFVASVVSELGNVSTTTTSSTTTTTCPPPTGQVLKGALLATVGRFNYNLSLGLPGANSACNSNFAGTHACTYAELQAAAAACDLPGLTDTGAFTVTSFWAIDPTANPILTQCNDDALGGSNLNWEYGTAHTASRGQKVALTNATGVLGPLQTGIQCNIAGSNWVGCCQ